MPWKEVNTVSLRREFVLSAKREDVNISRLCREFEISRKTGYKWLNRYRVGGEAGLTDRSRRPHHSPNRTPSAVEEEILKVRRAHPAWGGRKIKAYLKRKGFTELPSPSTITAILWRHDEIDPEEAKKHQSFQRFEMEHPNQLWQMDFKGYFALTKGDYCHPLTVLDDHSRFLLGLRACPNETRKTVQEHLTDIFRRYGLPDRMLMDNGSPWGNSVQSPYTVLTTWLIRLDIKISHGRPYHPQTQGKSERLHRTLNVEVIIDNPMVNLCDCQSKFDSWWEVYNFERPHEALQLQPPASHYHPSSRPFPETLPPIIYDLNDIVRKVDSGGKISFRNRLFRVSKAFRHTPVALRPADVDGSFDVFFCKEKVANICLKDNNC
jgi:transposase InsO family protein